MNKKTLSAIVALLLVGTVSATYAVISGTRISNEIDSYTHLGYPVRLTKLGDIPSETIPGVPYSYSIITENLNPSKSYVCRTVFEISNGFYIYPLFPEPATNGALSTPVNITIFPPYNFTLLSPDMVTLHYKTYDINLTLDQSRNVLVGYTEAFSAGIGYRDEALVTITFNETAIINANYNIDTWVEMIE